MEPPEPNLTHLDLDRHALGNAAVEQLLRDIVESVKALGRRNEELQRTNEELHAALEEAREKLSRLEVPTAADQLARNALQMAVQLLRAAEEAARAEIDAARVAAADDYEQAVGTALDLQREAVRRLADAREDALRRRLEAQRKGLERLAQARAAIQSLVEVSGIGQEETARDPQGWQRPTPGAEPTRAAATEGESARAASEAPPMTVELAASPLDTLSALLDFQKAVRALPGIEDVAVLAFEGGRLRLRVRYSGPVHLADRLQALQGFRVQPATVGPDRIDLLVTEPEEK